VPSDKPTQSTINHAVLGPGIAVFDDRGRTRLRRTIYIIMVPLGIFGIWLGRGDLVAGNTLVGIGQTAGALVVAGYSVLAIRAETKRLASPIRLVIARDGFELGPGDRPVGWDEVASIGDPKSPIGDPRLIRVQLTDPRDYEERHAYSLFGHLNMMFNKGSLILGSGMAMPLAEVETMMRTRLAESRGASSADAAKLVRAPRPKRRTSATKS
jgi:hypothetical protein